jgi:predicted dinucleotide-binding enzyme
MGIIGAGYIGRALAVRLVSLGHSVRIARAAPKRWATWPKGPVPLLPPFAKPPNSANSS